MAGNGRGLYFLPEIDDEVLVMFQHGDVRFPYVIGSLWNGRDRPPAGNADGENNLRVIRSRSGHVIRFDDTAGKESIEIRDAGDRNRIVIDTARDRITITSAKDLSIAAPTGTLSLMARKIEVRSAADTNVRADGRMELSAGGNLDIDGSIVNIN